MNSCEIPYRTETMQEDIFEGILGGVPEEIIKTITECIPGDIL